ncbi:MAG: uroporphyrinogen-III synthase [Alphaproteobacteria bacterium]|nr:MAG: uroporphyrinogen-III synthase [Alphaproteobacteria bacterium]
MTATRTPVILITRPAEQAVKLAEELRTRGLRFFSEPMLEIQPVSHRLPQDVQVDALIFTSARGVEHWQNIPQDMLQKPVYAVGKKTVAILQEKGFRNIAGTAPSARALETVFKRESAKNRLPVHMLHICGKDRAHHFDVKNTKITSFTVYSAVRVENFTKNLQSLLHNREIGFVLFYSVRTAENFIRLSKNYELTEKYGQITAICISTRTAQALKDVQWGNILTAEKPDHAHMLHCLEQQFL